MRVRFFFKYSILGSSLSLPCAHMFHFEMLSGRLLSHASSIYETIHVIFTAPATWSGKVHVIQSSGAHRTSPAISLGTVNIVIAKNIFHCLCCLIFFPVVRQGFYIKHFIW